LSLFWAGVAFFWEYSMLSSGGPLMLSILGIPFILIAIYMVIGRFFYSSWRRKKTYYALTNQRLVWATDFFKKRSLTVDLKEIDQMKRLTKPNGELETIQFYHQGPWYFRRISITIRGKNRSKDLAFDLIPEAEQVYDLINQARAKLEE
ncbi:MAG: hypothetical protein AAF598_20340, partial [Bacteroidota bacterium]